MTQRNEDDAETIAELRKQLADRDSEIAKYKHELDNTTSSFKTVLALKKQKIRELEEDNHRLKIKELEDRNARLKAENDDTISNELKLLRLTLARVEASTRAITQKITNNEVQPPLQEVKEQASNLATSGIIRAKFNDISKLTTDEQHSRAVKIAGIEWAITISTNMKDSIKHLSAFLIVRTRPIPESLSCSICWTIRLLRQVSKAEPLSSENNHRSIFTKKRFTRGRSSFIKFEDLLNPANNYVKDDSIMMEIELTAYPSE